MAGQRETTIRTYKNSGDFAKESATMTANGWTVANTVEHRPRQGCLRIVMMGFIFAFIFPPKPEIVVTYERLT